MTDSHLPSRHLPGRPTTLAALGALLACVGFALPTASNAHATDAARPRAAAPVGVLQLNVCHSGKADCYTGDDRAINAGIAAIQQRGPAMVTLNEVCANDITTMTKRTGYHAEFTPAGRKGSGPYQCSDGRGDYGVAILAHPDLGAPSGQVVERRYTAQDGGDEQRVMLCAPFSSISACTTHLSAADPAVAAEQCRELTAVATGLGRPTVIGGDLNLTHGGNPDVQECVPAGWFRKGDGSVQHVLASGDFGFERAENMPIDGTDHPGFLVELTR